MGYESNFEVPDIDDTLLRGVDDLTDLLCPDSHPEDYASRGYQGTCVFFWLLLFVLSLRGFFFPRREEERARSCVRLREKKLQRSTRVVQKDSPSALLVGLLCTQ